jgi:hypothetical protein
MPRSRTVYYVTATHPHPAYCFDRKPVKVSQDYDETFYADDIDHGPSNLGCGKNYSTAERAINGLFNDHACTVTKIETV